MIEPLQQLSKTLKDRGFNVTNPRRVVFEALQDTDPLTMQQLIKACPEINQTSVYRVVDLFIRLGIIKKIQIGWKYKIELSGEFRDHHHHLSCMRCGAIVSFEEGERLEKYLHAIAREHDFEMREHQLEIQGLCSSCRPQYA